jgi:parvulin-like peptidyl-prolyl isomerase
MTQQDCNGPRPRRASAGRRWGMIAGGLLLLAACAAVRYFAGGESASAEGSRAVAPAATPTTTSRAPTPSAPGVRTAAAASQPTRPTVATAPSSPSSPPTGGAPRSPAPPAAGPEAAKPTVVAVVNGEQITRDQLGRECIRHYGAQVLEGMVNRYLIMAECQRRNVTVTREEVDAEIARIAQRFRLPVDQWLKMLKQERGISPYQYANDIIWPTLALRKLAGERMKVTHQELVEAFENRYGPSVDARLIACASLEKAQQVRARAAADPESFGALARQYSEDASAGLNGRIQPIRKHCGHDEIEQAAFRLADGEVSEVIPAGGQYVILRRERLLPGPAAIRFEQVAGQLEEMIRDQKLRGVAAEVFRQLQENARVENIWNDPVRRQQMPGVAAVLNGRQITIREMAEQCIERHGEDVLEGVINRKLIEQACKQRNIVVAEEELDAEITRAAALMVPPKPDGSPDVETWLKTVTESQDVSVDVYRSSAVWPSVALQKLAAADVKVTEEDLKRGFEANYGPRVRCRAIVLANFRRAQEVWELARQNPGVERFGDLAEQYSVEPGSQALRGEVPPIKRYGGQPLLEEKAFELKPGELSGIIQVEDKFVILLCEGRTEPTEVTFEEVRPLLYEDILEKKQHLAMADYFERLQDSASIDNYLAGTTQSPRAVAGPQPASPPAAGSQPSARVPTLRQVPGG